MVHITQTSKNTPKADWGFDLTAILTHQRSAFDAAPNPNWAERKANLQKLGQLIEQHADDFKAAISRDFGNRSFTETALAEIMVIKAMARPFVA